MDFQVPKQKTYYDYAIKKLDIARKNGVIPLQSMHIFFTHEYHACYIKY